MIDDVIFFHRGRRLAFTTTFLCDIIINWLGFGIARPRYGHDYRLFRNQIFTAKIGT